MKCQQLNIGRRFILLPTNADSYSNGEAAQASSDEFGWLTAYGHRHGTVSGSALASQLPWVAGLFDIGAT